MLFFDLEFFVALADVTGIRGCCSALPLLWTLLGDAIGSSDSNAAYTYCISGNAETCLDFIQLVVSMMLLRIIFVVQTLVLSIQYYG